MDLSMLTIDNIRHLPLWFTATIVGIFAGLLGSFINVCIYRIPLGESVITPRSRCTSCQHVLGVLDLFPIISWLVLRGACRHCGAKVSARYTLVELAIVVIWVGAFISFGVTSTFLLAAISSSVLFTCIGIAIYGRSLKVAKNSKGLTFLEILFTAIILAAVVGPFLNLNWTGRAGAVRNRERIIAYGLAREKLEELRCIPVRKLCGDWQLYRGKGSGTAQNIFRDEFFGTWAKMDEDKELFWNNMSDILTDKGRCGSETMPEQVFEKFKRNFKAYYGFDFEPYPDDYRAFRRTTKVDDLTVSTNPGNILKRVTVTVQIQSKVHNGYKVTLSSYYSDN